MTSYSGFLLGIFFGGGGGKSIVMQISFVMLLFLGPNFREGQKFSGEETVSRGHPLPPLWKKASIDVITKLNGKICTSTKPDK